MAAFRRSLTWSSSEQHFVFDANIKEYVEDDGVRGVQEDTHTEARRYWPYSLQDAIEEMVEHFRARPANPWERGKVLTLYGLLQSALTNAHSDCDDSVIADGAAFYKSKRHDREYFEIERRILEIMDIIIDTNLPHATINMLKLVNNNSPSKINNLNTMLSSISPTLQSRLHNIAGYWIRSFEKPYTLREITDSGDEINIKAITPAVAKLLGVTISDISQIFPNEGDLSLDKERLDQ